MALYSSTAENRIAMDDLNVSNENASIKYFCCNYNLVNLIKEAAHFKNPKLLSYIELNFINKPQVFQNFCDIGTHLFHFQKLTLAFMRKPFL